MKIEYKSNKWDREMKKRIEARKIYRNGYYEYINDFIEKGFIAQGSDDYCWLYMCLHNKYKIISYHFYIDEQRDDVIKSTYFSGISLLLVKRLYDNGVKTNAANLHLALENIEYSICQLISVDCFDSVREYCQGSIMACLYMGDEKTARELIYALPDNSDEFVSVYYNEPFFLKKIYIAILEKDEMAFNDVLVKRIKKYRKNMVGYSTIIDCTSIALIKIAKKYGLSCNFTIIEIPEFFFEQINTTDLLQMKLPLYDRVEKLLELF